MAATVQSSHAKNQKILAHGSEYHFEKVQFSAKFDLLTPIGKEERVPLGKSFSKGNIYIVGSVLLVSNFMQKIKKMCLVDNSEDIFEKVNFEPKT